MVAIFALLTALLAVINAVSFTMAGEDADRLTDMLRQQNGAFAENAPASGSRGFRQGRFGPMGPESPETGHSLRYFTIAFDESGQAQTVKMQISAVGEEEAVEWARELLDEQAAGWTKGTYRYRVYAMKGQTFVTVIDQGRELISAYRILRISVLGEALCLIVCAFALKCVGGRVFSPLKDAERRQRKFLQGADREFSLPLSIISADTELMERRYGPDDNTRSIRRQVGKMEQLVRRLGGMALFEAAELNRTNLPLGEVLEAAVELRREQMTQAGLSVTTDIDKSILLSADAEAMKRVMDELTDNALKFAKTRAAFSLRREGERVILRSENDADLPDGPCDQVFDRFTTLENAPDGAGAGLGLSCVKDIVLCHKGRASARVENGLFILEIDL